MVTRMLHELAGPSSPSRVEETWLPHERDVKQITVPWDNVCRQAIQRRSAEELHPTRDDYRALLESHLKILDGYLTLFGRFKGECPHRILGSTRSDSRSVAKTLRLAVSLMGDARRPRSDPARTRLALERPTQGAGEEYPPPQSGTTKPTTHDAGVRP